MAAARLLDLTRSLRRTDRGATGIDRVEHAYLARFSEGNMPAFGLVRTPLGYLLLDQNGLSALLQRLSKTVPWGSAKLLSRIGRRRSVMLQRAESDLRQLAIARARRGKLPALLAKHLPDGFDYYNVGHSNLTKRVFDAIKGAGGHTHVLIHDVIPLTHPEYQRSATVETFRNKLTRVSEHAARVIFNSDETKKSATPILQKMGRVPPSIVAHLGTTPPYPDQHAVPMGLTPAQPYFVTVGTIEPRKNHQFLLDLWQEMGASAPPLLICGARGWNNEKVFSQLDALPTDSPIKELPNLSDAALAALVQGSAGALFPSHVEGFGLPPLEALALRTRVLCNDLPVLKEFLHDKPVYASVFDRYLWISTIKNWAKNPPSVRSSEAFVGPTWAEHFKIVLRVT